MRELRRRLGKAWLAAFGWTVEGGVPDVPKAVVIAAPHTSNWDLPFTLAVSYALGVEIRWIGKHTIFKPPFGRIMRFFGGISVDRRRRSNAVASVVDVIRRHDQLLLIIPPEGTRMRAPYWKTGFYYIALGAGVPIVLGFLDYEKKCGGLGHVFHPSGDIDADIAKIREFYRGVRGRFPDQASDIVLRPEDRAAD